MKKIHYILIAIFTVMVCGCIKEPLGIYSSESSQSIKITMNINNEHTRAASGATSDAGVLGSGEYIVDCLRIYVFGSNGELDKMMLYEDLYADHSIYKEIEVPRDNSKELYFVANEPSALSSTLEGVTSAEDLEQIDFTLADAMDKGFNGAATFTSTEFMIPMSEKYSVQNAQSDVHINVALTRAVARVDLYLHKGESAASRIVELNSSTNLKAEDATISSKLLKLFEGDKPVVSDSDLKDIEVTSSEITLTDLPQRVFSFYTAERQYNKTENPIIINVDGLIEDDNSVENKSVTLGKGTSLSEINRNHVYRIYGSYDGDEIVADSIEQMKWTDVEINGEIEGVMVAVDNEVAMDWLRNGNSFISKPISFGSNKPISIYLPVSDDSQEEGYTFKQFDFGLGDMSEEKTYDLKTIALANNYIFETPWIESASIHFTSSKSGYLTFTYHATNVFSDEQFYPIRIKSDNVMKQMMAVYDNGYLPASELSVDWRERAAGGVVFAKRGDAKHPLSTPEVFYADSDGYYRGEHQATAAEALRYCEETFGEGWYMPSYANMVEIAPKFDMLGVSYRFQDNGSDKGSGSLTESRYWTTTASSSDDGKYWSGDFMRRDYMNNNLMELKDGANRYFVRCVMDLK